MKRYDKLFQYIIWFRLLGYIGKCNKDDQSSDRTVDWRLVSHILFLAAAIVAATPVVLMRTEKVGVSSQRYPMVTES